MPQPRKPRPKTRPRKPILPRMDIQGVIARNEEYLSLMHSLEAMLPRVSTDPHTMELVGAIVSTLEYVPPNLGSLNAHDKAISSKATQLFLALQKDWAKVQDSPTKQALKGYMERVDRMAADLGVSRAAPRNMKEVLARNFLGLQPQDVRTKGLLKTYMKETAMDLKILFGGNAKDMIQDQRRADHRAQNEADVRKGVRRDHEEALHDDADFEQQKVNAIHEQALNEDRERNKAKERDKAHEEAMEEDAKRDESTASGIPFVSDAVRDKELIHAQALDIEEKLETHREEVRLAEKEKKKTQQKEGKAAEAHIENHKDDSVAAALLGEVKAIHKLLEKGGVGTGEGTGSGGGKPRKKTASAVDEREKEIQKIMKTLGYSAKDPEGRKLAEKALASGVKSSGEEAVVSPLIAEDRKAAEEDAYVEQEERNQKQAYEMSIEQARIEEKENDHGHALRVNDDFDRKGREQGFVADRDVAHTQALELQKQFDHERASRTNDGVDRKATESNFVPNSPELHATALETDKRFDAIAASNERNAAVMQKHAAVMQKHTDAMQGQTATSPAPTILGGGGVGGGIMPRLRKFGAGIKAAAGMSVGASGLATAGVAAGGLAAGYGIGTWANNNLGLKSEGERMNDAAKVRDTEVEENSHRVARERGYQSFEAMKQANRSRAQLAESEKVRQASVESLERQGIDESMLEPNSPLLAPPVVNNYNNTTTAPPTTPTQPQTVFIRAVHPSFMRYQERRMSRILHPQGVV